MDVVVPLAARQLEGLRPASFSIGAPWVAATGSNFRRAVVVSHVQPHENRFGSQKPLQQSVPNEQASPGCRQVEGLGVTGEMVGLGTEPPITKSGPPQPIAIRMTSKIASEHAKIARFHIRRL